MTDERLGITSEYTREPVSNEQAAAEWLQRRIREVVGEAERMFGVYVNTLDNSAKPARGDFWRVQLVANLWPESMRIIEREPTSNAIG